MPELFPEQKPITRAERRHQERLIRKQTSAGKHKRYRWPRLLIWLIFVLGLGLLIWGLVRIATRPLLGEVVASLGNQHIETIETAHAPYNSEPPTSGPHVGNIAAWGVHTEPVPDPLQIHNLEDGGVIVQYDCANIPTPAEICNAWIKKLTALVQNYPEQVLLAPRPSLDTGIALTAWTRLDKWTPVIDSNGTITLDIERIEAFIRAYRGIDHHVPGAG